MEIGVDHASFRNSNNVTLRVNSGDNRSILNSNVDAVVVNIFLALEHYRGLSRYWNFERLRKKKSKYLLSPAQCLFAYLSIWISKENEAIKIWQALPSTKMKLSPFTGNLCIPFRVQSNSILLTPCQKFIRRLNETVTVTHSMGSNTRAQGGCTSSNYIRNIKVRGMLEYEKSRETVCHKGSAVI